MSDDEGFIDNEDISEVEFSENEFSGDEDEDGAVVEVELEEKELDNEEEINEEEAIVIDFEDDENLESKEESKKKSEKVEKEKRITLPFLTKFEKARILGTRAVQLSQGAKTQIKIKNYFDPVEINPIEIAKKELQAKIIPLIIRRHLPNGKYEDWSVNELVIL
jgi:DNA-directed RNA polymerase I, II, and III subunit RPABC2